MSILIGSLISLVSVVVGMVVQHWLELRKLVVQARGHPMRVIYNKQVDFFDKAVPTLRELNRYLTCIDVWLSEHDSAANKKAADAAASNRVVEEFHELVERYYMYLPEKLLKKAQALHLGCLFLSHSFTEDRTSKCLEMLFDFQKAMREVVGVGPVSTEFLKMFGASRHPDNKS